MPRHLDTEGLTPRRMRKFAYLILVASEDIHLDSLIDSEQALGIIQECQKELADWEAIAKRAVKIFEKEYLENPR
jgi:hypothetical protein